MRDVNGVWDVAWPLRRLVEANLSHWSDHSLPLPRDLLAFGDDGTGKPFCLRLHAASEAHSEVVSWSWIDDHGRAVAPDLYVFWLRWLQSEIKT